MFTRWTLYRTRNDGGSVTVEYGAISILIFAVVVAVTATSLPGTVADGVRYAICRVFQDDCEPIGTATSGSDDQDGSGNNHNNVAANQPDPLTPAQIEAAQNEREDFVSEEGGQYSSIESQIDDLLAQWRLAEASHLSRTLDNMIDIADQGERGEFLNEMWSASDAQFENLMDDGNIRRPHSSNRDDASHQASVRYFDVPVRPGRGLMIIDNFIPFGSSGGLQGDDRDHENPLDLSLDESRVTLFVDYETGRGVIYSSHSCLNPVGLGQVGPPFNLDLDVTHCNKARGFAFSHEGEDNSPGLGSRHRVNIEETDDGELIYDADLLNSIEPFRCSADAYMEIEYPSNGGPPSVINDDMDHYPSIGWWWYDPDTGEVTQFDEQNSSRAPPCGNSRGPDNDNGNDWLDCDYIPCIPRTHEPGEMA